MSVEKLQVLTLVARQSKNYITILIIANTTTATAFGH